MLTIGQLPEHARAVTPNFQIEVGCDQVGKDKGFGGNEEDHAPPVKASACDFMLSSTGNRFGWDYTHDMFSIVFRINFHFKEVGRV